MGRRTATIALALLVLPALAGCFSDLERVRLETGWDAEARLNRGPVEIVDGLPAMLVFEGTLSVSPDATVELTGVSGSLSSGNRSIGLQAARLSVGDRTMDPDRAVDERITLSDGQTARVTFLPRKANGTQLGNETRWDAHAELTYRFRDGSRFDAGRFVFDGNLTAEPAGPLGVGVARVEKAQITSLVFADPLDRAPAGQAQVQVFHVTPDEVTRRANRTTSLEAGTGVRLASLSSPVGIPKGSGYQLVFVDTSEATGVVARSDRPTEQPVPGLGAALVLVAIVSAATSLARRRS